MSAPADDRHPKPPRDPRVGLAVASLVSALLVPLALARPSEPEHTAVGRGEQTSDYATVASTILDSDELLLTLLSEEEVERRVLSVSNFAREPDLSNVTNAAAKVAHVYHRGESELPLSLGADVVFTSPFSDAHAQRLWRSVNIPVIALMPATRLDAVRANIETCAQALSVPTRGQRIQAWMTEAENVIRQAMHNVRPRRVLIVQSGYVVGEETLMDDVLALANLQNHAKALGIIGHAPVSIAALARNPPEVLARIALRADEKRRDMVPSADKLALAALEVERIDLTPRFALSTSPYVLFAAAELTRKVHGVDVVLPPIPRAELRP